MIFLKKERRKKIVLKGCVIFLIMNFFLQIFSFNVYIYFFLNKYILFFGLSGGLVVGGSVISGAYLCLVFVVVRTDIFSIYVLRPCYMDNLEVEYRQ